VFRVTSPSITYKAESDSAARLDAAWDDDPDPEDEVTHIYGVAPMGEDDDYGEDDKTREFPFAMEVEPEPEEEEDETREIPKRPAARTAIPIAAFPASSLHTDATVVELTHPKESRAPRVQNRPPSIAPPPRPAPLQVEFLGPIKFSAPPVVSQSPALSALALQARRAPVAPPRTHIPARGPALPPAGSTPAAWVARGSSPDLAAPLPRGKQPTATHARPFAPLSWRAALGAPAVAALVALGFALWPAQGRILVNVKDARGGPVHRLEVFVDGETTSCATAPCYLTCEPGVHEIKIMAKGFEVPASQAVAVKAGDSAAVQFTVSTGGGSGIKVSGAQPGVKLFVDGKEMGPLPQILHDLPPGDHVIRLAGSQRYQPIERHVSVEPDKVTDLGSISLKVVKGYVTVNPGTPGARVYMVSGPDRRELTMLPISLDIDTTTAWSLEATKTGFEDYHQAIGFDDGLAEKTYTVNLDPKGSSAPSSYAQSAPAPYSAPAMPAPAPPPPAPVAATPPPPPAAAAGEGGEAYLNINSIPPSTCVLDGKPLGSTPKLHVTVRAGTHRVTFRTMDGSTKTMTVSVGAGETRLAATRLDE
jgi:serine/threonine-protein kinase